MSKITGGIPPVPYTRYTFPQPRATMIRIFTSRFAIKFHPVQITLPIYTAADVHRYTPPLASALKSTLSGNGVSSPPPPSLFLQHRALHRYGVYRPLLAALSMCLWRTFRPPDRRRLRDAALLIYMLRLYKCWLSCMYYTYKRVIVSAKIEKYVVPARSEKKIPKNCNTKLSWSKF